jgi:hypothetical protein
MVFKHAHGGETSIEMGTLMEAAQERIEEAFAAQQAKRATEEPLARDLTASANAANRKPRLPEARESSSTSAPSHGQSRAEPTLPGQAAKSAGPPAQRAAAEARPTGRSTIDRPTVPLSPVETGQLAVNDQTPLEVGSRLEAEWGRRWYPAQVVQLLPDGQVKVHYEGYDSNFDEVVSRSRLWVAAGTGQRLPASPAAAQSPAAVSGAALKVGTRLEIEWGGRWYPGEVIQVLPDGKAKVHYDGFSSGFDEVVPPARLRTASQ